MIPWLYAESETAFTGAGLGRLVDCISCRVTEERNGIYECEFQYPVNGPMFKEIKPRRIIYVSHDVGGDLQPFDIYAYRIDLGGVATYYAQHISYRLNHVIMDFEVTASIRAMIAGWWYQLINFPDENWFNILPYNVSFSFSLGGLDREEYDRLVSITSGRVGKLYTVRDFLMGDSNSIKTVINGEFTWNKFTILYGSRRGSDTTAIIRPSLNLNSMTYEYDESDIRDSVAPYYTVSTTGSTYEEQIASIVYLNGNNNNQKSDGSFTALDEDAIDIDNDPKGTATRLAALDLTGEFSEAPTQADLYEKAIEQYNNLSVVHPRETLTINFQPLWESPEYEYIAPAEKLKLCDTATVIIPEIGLAKRMKVVKVVWDALVERYVSMEFGSQQRTIYNVASINGTKNEADPYADIDPSTYIDPTGL